MAHHRFVGESMLAEDLWTARFASAASSLLPACGEKVAGGPDEGPF
ncbi:hypothetical protein USDA257_c58420 [Sinorhizobium fredii USDA 257]|jgi:hypothetical protein|uniref:Uncharacterized protein n=1 Tax=Sinorhizobium fredii (strain USDA 257) TaxID=1185652 RepID=I3XEP7_SINF2|nr:hypothetical protein USDA257_c58420 [Sinorhizobium fredii USDA 257]